MLVTQEPEVSEYPQFFKGMVPICLTWTMKMTFFNIQWCFEVMCWKFSIYPDWGLLSYKAALIFYEN